MGGALDKQMLNDKQENVSEMSHWKTSAHLLLLLKYTNANYHKPLEQQERKVCFSPKGSQQGCFLSCSSVHLVQKNQEVTCCLCHAASCSHCFITTKPRWVNVEAHTLTGKSLIGQFCVMTSCIIRTYVGKSNSGV